MLGTAGTASAFGPAAATPTAVGGLRLAAGAVVLLALLPLLGGRWRNLPRLLRRPTIWAMAIGAAAYQPLFFGAVQRSGVALSTLLTVGAAPICTAWSGGRSCDTDRPAPGPRPPPWRWSDSCCAPGDSCGSGTGSAS